MDFFNGAKSLKTNTKSVLFVTSQLRQREIKMAHAVKSLGWEVGLIYYNSTPFKPKGHFDYIWEVGSAEEAHRKAKKLSPRLVHVFSGAIDDYILLFCRDKVAPVIIDLNDIFTPSLMDYCPERYTTTSEALALADGYSARDLQLKCAEKLDKCKIPPNVIFFPEYCWNNKQIQSRKKIDDEIHLVSVGTISLETYGMYDCCYLELVKMIINQDIHFHMYPPWCYRKDFSHDSSVNFERDYAQFLELERISPYLHIHDSLPAEKLAGELSQYDFGIISGGCKAFGQRFTHFKKEYVDACYSGRITDYLEARLPVLINGEVVFDYWLLKRYGVCVDLKGILQPGFKDYLLHLKKHAELDNHIDYATRRLSIAENAPRLADFYSKVMLTEGVYTNKNVKLLSIFKRLAKIIPDSIVNVGRYLTD